MWPDMLEVSAPLPLPAWWWAVIAALVLAALAVLALGIWRWRALAPAPVHVDDSLEEQRRAALLRIDEAVGGPDPRRATHEVVRATREFIGLASDNLVDYWSTSQLRTAALRDPRLAPLFEFVSTTQDARFSPHGALDPLEVGARAREVVTSWR